MNIVLHDAGLHNRFAPLTLTRPLGNIRTGIFTNDERWKHLLPEANIFFEAEDYLMEKFPSTSKADIVINASFIPNEDLVAIILALKDGEALY